MRYKPKNGSAPYLLPETSRRAMLQGVRVYVRDDDVLFITKQHQDGQNVRPGRELFLAVCPQCGDALWYEPGNEVPKTGKAGECCWPALSRAFDIARKRPHEALT